MASGNVFASLLSNKNKNKDTVQDNYKGVMDNITKQRENVLNTPTKESIEADLYSKPSQNWGEAFWQGRGARKKVDDLENGKGEMLNYLMEVGQSATKLNAEYAREQHAKEIAVPLMEKYNKIAPNLTPEQRVDAANQIRARLSEVLGQDLPPVIDTGGSKFENWVTQDPETGNVKYFDLLAELNPNGDKDLNSLERMAIQQQQFNNRSEIGKMHIDQQRVNAYNRDITNRWNPESQFNVKGAQTQGTEGNKMALKLQESNLELEDVAYDIAYLKDLLKGGQVITGDTLKAKSSRLWAESAGNQALSDSELYDATAKSLLKFANNNASFGNANMKEFDFLRAPVPDSHKTKDANRRLIERFEDKLKKQMARNDRIIAKYESFNPYQPPAKPDKGDQKNPPAKTDTGGGNGLWMTTPQKTRIWIPSGQVKQAYADGLVEE